MHALLRLFFNNSSLRGVGKIVKTSGILSFLWTTYVFAMLCIMIYSVYSVYTIYLSKQTSIVNDVNFLHPEKFPSITVCNYNPFSIHAEKYWTEGSIMSPDVFDKKLYNASMLHLAQHRDPSLAYRFFHSDRTSFYYQNLNTEDAIKIGHKDDDLFVFCSAVYGLATSRYRRGKSMNLCSMKAIRISHPYFFNCYSISAKGERFQRELTALDVVIQLNKGAKTPPQRNAFVPNVYEMARGLRVSIHENLAMPSMMDGQTINVGPGKYVEISYMSHMYQEVHSTDKTCYANKKDWPRVPELLSIDLNYTQHACVQVHLNKYIVKKCGCMMVNYPRLVSHSDIPYCHHVDFSNTTDYIVRHDCLANLQLTEEKDRILQDVCFKRCRHIQFDFHVSTIDWEPREWKLDIFNTMALNWSRFKKASRKFIKMKKSQRAWMKRKGLNETGWQSTYNKIMRDYTIAWARREAVIDKLMADWISKGKMSTGDTKSNRSMLKLAEDSNNTKDTFDEIFNSSRHNWACIRIKRPDFQRYEHRMNFILSFIGFVSQIGGLCSVTLGLTCAFFIEIIEYLYLLVTTFYQEQRESRNKRRRPVTVETQPEEDNAKIALKLAVQGFSSQDAGILDASPMIELSLMSRLSSRVDNNSGSAKPHLPGDNGARAYNRGDNIRQHLPGEVKIHQQNNDDEAGILMSHSWKLSAQHHQYNKVRERKAKFQSNAESEVDESQIIHQV